MATNKNNTNQEGSVRVRFAPSPTGPFHIGNLRSALFNYLFAKKYQGKMILRIEDTDKERSEKKWEQGIVDSLQWAGITWDEGPYYQSQRTEIYEKYLKQLLQKNKAYYCFCSKDDLEAHKQYLMSIGKPPIYSGKCRELLKEEVEEKIKRGLPYVLRFKTTNQKVIFHDLVLGKVEQLAELLGDFVIAKNEKEVLYNFACVVDDYEMKITDVIRGGDHISNTPKQILLYQALGLEWPRFCHLPLVLGEDKSKLSKRHGAVFIPEYKKEGYLAEALVNFLALLGWNPKDNREVFSLKELEKEFSVEKIQKSPAVFNENKLDWLNGFYLRHLNKEELTKKCLPYLIESGIIEPILDNKVGPLGTAVYGVSEVDIAGYQTVDTKTKISWQYLVEVIALYQERLKKLSEVGDLVDFFFQKEIEVDSHLLKWKDMPNREIKRGLEKSYQAISKLKEKDWRNDLITAALLKEADDFAKGDKGCLLWPLRVALSGKKASASPFDLIYILGKKRSLERIE
ncbi:glutamate--tRNA ligase, partial [Candidatus Gribaldobacteria bacterium]|nr:glutamate--tRNA ligase [Candidatus Gribaldobacteria bacterium]